MGRVGDVESDVRVQLHRLRGTLRSSAASSEREMREREALENLLRSRIEDLDQRLHKLASEVAQVNQVGKGNAQLIEELAQRCNTQHLSVTTDVRDMRSAIVEHTSIVSEDVSSLRGEQRSTRTTLNEHIATTADRFDEVQKASERGRAQLEAHASRHVSELLTGLRWEITQATTSITDVVDRKVLRLQAELEEVRSMLAVERNLHEEASVQAKASSAATEHLRVSLEEVRSSEHARGLKCAGQFVELDEQQRMVGRRLSQVGVDLAAQAAATEELKRHLHHELHAHAAATVALANQQANSKKELAAWHRETELRTEGVEEQQKASTSGLRAEIALSREEQQKVHALALEAYRGQKEQLRISDEEVERKLERCIQSLHINTSTMRWRG